LGTARSILLLIVLGTFSACGRPPANPSPAPSPSPSPDVFSFVAQDDRGRWPVAVAVVDLSGDLTQARAATAAELREEIERRPMEGAAGGLSAFDASDRVVLLIWGGAGCDRSTAIRVSSDGSSLTVVPDRDPGCEGPLTYRGAVLTLDRPVDVGSIRLDIH
jgi:hypothetical protein